MKAELPELFVLQSLITLDCLQSPIKDQMAAFKNIDEQEKRYIKHMRERGEALLKDTMRQAGAVQVLQRDSLWSKSKNLINTKQAKQADRLSHSQFDLTNFDQPIHQLHEVKTSLQNKRNQKAQEKRLARPELLVSERQPVNRSRNAKTLFQMMKMDGEKKVRVDTDAAATTNVKKGQLKRLNDYVNPILADQDPENCIEEEYKHKHQQVFCWRFLRTVSYLDQSAFFPRKGTTGESKVKTFNGEVEPLARHIHEQAKKREIKEERPEEEHDQDEEEQHTP